MRHALVVLAALLFSSTVAFGLAAATDSKPAHAGAYVTGCSGAQVYLTDREQQMLELHNQERSTRGLPNFCVHPTLQEAARAHSIEMIDKDYFSHYSYNGESFSARLTRYGYNCSMCAENIGSGTGSYGGPDHIFGSWMNSSGHRVNILDPRLKEVGIGEAYGTYKAYSNASMWTVDFGTSPNSAATTTVTASGPTTTAAPSGPTRDEGLGFAQEPPQPDSFSPGQLAVDLARTVAAPTADALAFLRAIGV